MKSFIPSILWSIFILVLSTIPSINLPETFWDLLAPDKFGHAIVYGILTILILNGLVKKKISNSKAMLMAVRLASLYGILMELIQFSFFPGRYFEILDIIANIIGSFGSLFVFHFFIK